jgi:hypothetical protein
LTKLAQALLRRSREGAIKWRANDDDNTSFRANLMSGIVVIRSRDRDNHPPYRLIVYPRGGGEPIETLQTSDSLEDVWNDTLEQLYGEARNGALGLGDTLDALIAEVETADAADFPQTDDVELEERQNGDFPGAADDDILF